MVDVSGKPLSNRTAVATGKIRLRSETLNLISKDQIAKGNVFVTARIAGIQAGKQTAHIIPLSDRASAGDYKDLGGPALREAAQKAGWQVLAEAIVPDDTTRIQETIRSFSQQGCGVILATGGTGIGPRDVTPEAIRAIMRVELPGFGEVMRAESMKITPNSILSRSLAAIVDHALVIAL